MNATTIIIIALVVIIVGFGIGGVAAMMFKGKGATNKPPAASATAPDSAVSAAPERADVTAMANPAAASDETVELSTDVDEFEIHLAGLTGEEWSES